MGLYFCNNLVLRKEALKMAYICKETKQICPRVKYSVTGEASPDVLFSLKGCKLLDLKQNDKKKEEAKIEKVEKKEETIKIEKEVSIKPKNYAKKKRKTQKK